MTRPTLEEVYLELTAEAERSRMSAAALAWSQFRFERQAVLAQPERRVLQLRAAAAVPRPDRDRVLRRRRTSSRCSIPGIAGMGVIATTFTALAFNLTFRREEGILKRIRGTPMPAGAYFAGFIGSATLNAVLQVAIVVTIGNVVYDVDWPQDLLLLLAGFTLLGVVCFAALGVAFSHVIPNLDSAPAYTNAVFLPLIFISGVFYSADDLPEALRVIAEALPLKHVVDGFSDAIVGGGARRWRRAALRWSAAGPCCRDLPGRAGFFRWEWA